MVVNTEQNLPKKPSPLREKLSRIAYFLSHRLLYGHVRVFVYGCNIHALGIHEGKPYEAVLPKPREIDVRKVGREMARMLIRKGVSAR